MRRRPAAWARTEMRRETLRWARYRWREVAQLTVLLGGSAVAFWLSPLGAFQRGVAVGVLLTALAALVTLVVVVASGQLPRLWGMAGEGATAEELQSRRRRRQGWQVVHGLRLGAEIDHVAVGPGGVLALESKWAPTVRWEVTATGIRGPRRDPVTQAQRGARNVAALLAQRRYGSIKVDVIPVVMIWGPGAPFIEGGPACFEGVRVFSGRDIGALRRWLDERRLDESTVHTVQSALASYAAAQTANGHGPPLATG